MNEKKRLVNFIEKSGAFDQTAKLKLFLFISAEKPSTYAHLRIQKNLHDKHEFEELLKANGIIGDAGRAKGFEEITAVKNNAAIWKMTGTWYGYDLFKNKQYAARFLEYIELLKLQKHALADQLAGVIYGYPRCCVKEFLKRHSNPKALAKKYSYYQYYKFLHDSDRKFPFIQHTPCSLNCKETKKLNKKYSAAVKKAAPKFYKEYTAKKKHKASVIVDTENTIPGIWKTRNGHDYILITKQPINGRHYLLSWLSKAKFKKGTVLDASITTQYDYAEVKINKKTGEIKNFHHERKFTKL